MFKRLGYTLLFLGCSLIAALTIAPSFINWEQYRTQIQSYLSQEFGHKIIVEGDIDLSLVPATTVSLHKVLILNDAGNSALADIDHLSLQTNVFDLLKKTPKFSKIKVERPTIRLPLLTGNRLEAPLIRSEQDYLPFQFEDIQIEEAALYIDHHPKLEPLFLNNTKITIKSAGQNGPYVAQGAGFFLNEPWQLDLTTGKYAPTTSSLPLSIQYHFQSLNLSGGFDGKTKLSFPLYLNGEFSAEQKLETQNIPLWIKSFDTNTTAQLSLNGQLELLGDFAQLKSAHIETPLGKLDGKLSLKPTDHGSELTTELAATNLNFMGYESPFDIVKQIAAISAPALTSDQIIYKLKTDIGILKTPNGFARQLLFEGSCHHRNCDISSFSAQLPGGTHIEAAGEIVQNAPNDTFLYDLTLKASGLNLRLGLNWLNLAQIDQMLLKIPESKLRKFDLKGQFTGHKKAYQISNTQGTIDGSSFTLGFKHLYQDDKPAYGLKLLVEGGTPFAYILPLTEEPPTSLFSFKQLSPATASENNLAREGSSLQHWGQNHNLSFDIHLKDFLYLNETYKNLTLQGQIQQDILTLTKSELQTEAGAHAALKGSITPFSTPEILDLTAAVSASDQAALRSLTPLLPELDQIAEEKLSAKIKFLRNKGSERLALNVTADETELSLSKEYDFDHPSKETSPFKVRLKHPDSLKLFDKFQLSTSLFAHSQKLPLDLYFEASAAADQRWNLQNIQALLGGSGVTGSLSLHLSEDHPLLHGALQFDKLDSKWLTELIFPATRLKVETNWSPATLQAHWAKNLALELQISADQLTELFLPAQKAQFTLKMSPTLLAVQKLSFQTDEGTVAADVSTDLSRDDQTVSELKLQAQLTNIRPKASPTATEFALIDTSYDLDLNLSCLGQSLRDFSKDCSGEGILKLAPFQIKGLDLNGFALSLVATETTDIHPQDLFQEKLFTKFQEEEIKFNLSKGRLKLADPMILKFSYGQALTKFEYLLSTKSWNLDLATHFTTLINAPALDLSISKDRYDFYKTTQAHAFKRFFWDHKEEAYLESDQDPLHQILTKKIKGELKHVSSEETNSSDSENTQADGDESLKNLPENVRSILEEIPLLPKEDADANELEE